MKIIFKQQAASFIAAENRYLQKAKRAGIALISFGIVGEVVSLCHLPPVVEAMGATALFAREVHRRRSSELKEVPELVAWREWVQAQNLDIGENISSDRQEPLPKRSIVPLLFAGCMSIDAITSFIDEDEGMIPRWVIKASLEKTFDVLEKIQILDSEYVAQLKEILKKAKPSEEI